MKLSQKNLRLASACLAVVAMLVKYTDSKLDNQIVRILELLLQTVNKTQG